MKKRMTSLVLALAMCLSLCTTVFAADTEAEDTPLILSDADDIATYESYDVEMTDQDEYVFVDSDLVTPITRAGGDTYLYSYYKYVRHVIKRYDITPAQNGVFLVSVARGQTKSTTKTVKNTGIIGFKADASVDFRKAISSKLGANAQYELTVSVTTEEKFTFPAGEPGNSASFYLGIGYDEVTYTYDIYDVYLGSGSGGGMGTGNYTKNRATVGTTIDSPKKVVYSRTASY